MKILTEQKNSNDNLKKDVVMNNVLKRIWLLIKNDPDFYLKDKIDKIKDLEKKFTEKQEILQNLLDSACSIKKNMQYEINVLSQSSEEKRKALLEKIERK